MLTKNNTASDLIKRNQNRMLYANFLIQQQKFNNGCSARIQITSGSSADNSYATLLNIKEGAFFTTPIEQTDILSKSYCPIVVSAPAPAPAPAPLPTIAIYTWVQQASSPLQNYRGLTVTGDFTTQIATRNTATDGQEGPYISSDSGATWNRRVTGMTFATGAYTLDVTVARSNGNIMYTANRRSFGGTVASTYDDLYKSTDGGLNWSVISPAQCTWSSITCSSDGQVILAGNTNGPGSYDMRLVVSTNGGTSWTIGNVAGQWTIAAMNSSGSRLYACGVGSRGVFYSTNFGVSWSSTLITSDPRNIACSSDGLVVLVGTISAKPQLSTNGGLSFTEISALPAEDWVGVCVSEDGNTLAVASNSISYIWVSKNRGENWTEQTSSPNINWNGLDINSDATKISAGPDNDKVYIGTYAP